MTRTPEERAARSQRREKMLSGGYDAEIERLTQANQRLQRDNAVLRDQVEILKKGARAHIQGALEMAARY